MPNLAKVCSNCDRRFQSDRDFVHNTSRWRVCSSGNLWFNCSCESTLMIPKGKYPWYSPTANMSWESAKLFNSLPQQELVPHIPTEVMETLVYIQDPKCEAQSLAKKIKRDPLLANQVLLLTRNLHQVRNPHEKPIASLEHAIVYLGFRNVSDVLVTASLSSFKVYTKKYTTDIFWKESRSCGLITEYLANLFGYKGQGEDFYLAGCLVNIGKLLSASYFPDETDKIFSMVTNSKTLSSWSQAESKFNIDHCVLGEVACAVWGMSPNISDVCLFHHRQPMVGEDLRQKKDLVDLVSLALKFTHSVTSEFARFDENELYFLQAGFQISPKQADEMLLGFSKWFLEMKLI